MQIDPHQSVKGLLILLVNYTYGISLRLVRPFKFRGGTHARARVCVRLGGVWESVHLCAVRLMGIIPIPLHL